jgi:FlaA1/EpsC-like NDP-sugar epimerase
LAVRRSDRWFWQPSIRVGQFGRDRSAGSRNPLRSLLALVVRGRFLFALDLVGIVLASLLAFGLLQFDSLDGPRPIPALPIVVALLLAARTVANIKLGLYSRRWRYASVPELERIASAVVLGSVISIIVYGASELTGSLPGHSFPPSFWVTEALLSATIIGGLRFGIRAAYHHTKSSDSLPPKGRTTLLFGAGQAGVDVARSARREPGAGFRPVGFLDDDQGLAGQVVGDLPVFGGLESLERAASSTGADTLLITMPGATGAAVRRVVEAALAINLDVRTVPSLAELLDGSVDAYRARRVQLEDLLRRPMVTERAAGVDELFHDRTVMITGGGGSIGSELARQIFALGPRRLVLVDRAESPLYLIQRELATRRGRGQGSGEVRIHLGNVANRAEMARLISQQAPSVIIHTAAYKHVPLMEGHPSDAVHVNIGGTMVMVDAAESAGVEHFVFVSTDKAVRPSSVMGASKRIAEMLVAEAALRTGRPFVSVRFGNVLGSTGSVVPILREQLENGEPLTITHPDMTRFFMTIPEASRLILDAAALGRGADLFVLDMGEPIRVLDLAHDLVKLAGRDPDSQPIEIIGMRPGEKLHEELFYDAELVEPTTSSKVLRARTTPPPSTIREDARAMLVLATGADEPGLRQAILEYARGLEGHASSERDAPEEGPLFEHWAMEAVPAGLSASN